MIDEPSRFIGKEKTYVSTLKTKTTKIENIDKKNCFILQLCQIPMINHKIASKIANEFTCMRDFIKNLDSWAENDQISYLCSIENIGSKKAEKIIEYLL
jgi:Holliday junction resolvasome RuvABC DNA-binding subunit